MRLVEISPYHSDETKKAGRDIRTRQDAYLVKLGKHQKDKKTLEATNLETADPNELIAAGNRLKAEAFSLCRDELGILRDHIEWFAVHVVERRAAARLAKQAWDDEIVACKGRLIEAEGYAEKDLIPHYWLNSPKVGAKQEEYARLSSSLDVNPLRAQAAKCEEQLADFKRQFSQLVK